MELPKIHLLFFLVCDLLSPFSSFEPDRQLNSFVGHESFHERLMWIKSCMYAFIARGPFTLVFAPRFVPLGI